jgi:CO/xanthine dehydrogenase Mo-binding subunit
MADCAMGTIRFPSTAHVHLQGDGRAVIRSGTQDIGTGIATILTQIAGGRLGLEPGLVGCEIGDTDLPQARPIHPHSRRLTQATVCARLSGMSTSAELVQTRER